MHPLKSQSHVFIKKLKLSHSHKYVTELNKTIYHNFLYTFFDNHGDLCVANFLLVLWFKWQPLYSFRMCLSINQHKQPLDWCFIPSFQPQLLHHVPSFAKLVGKRLWCNFIIRQLWAIPNPSFIALCVPLQIVQVTRKG